MLQRKAFQKLRAYVNSQGYTPDQIRNADKDQIQAVLGLTAQEVKEYHHFWPGMHKVILSDALERERLDRLVLLRNQLNSVYNAANLSSERVEELAVELLPYLYGEAI